MEIEAVAQIAVEIGVLRLGRDGLAMPGGGLVKFALLVVEHRQSRAGIGSARIEFERFEICGQGLVGSAAFLEGPAIGDFYVRNPADVGGKS